MKERPATDGKERIRTNVCDVSNMLNSKCPCLRHWKGRNEAFIANSLYERGDRRRGGYDVVEED